MKSGINKWYVLLLVNLLLVALAGSLMRYKIIAPLPGFEQRNLMQAHSHFAFNAWVSLALILLLTELPGLSDARKGKWILFYYITCLVQFITFGLTGYSTLSLAFQFLFLIPLVVVLYRILRLLKNSDLPEYHRSAIRFGIFFQMLAQAGLLFLALMMVKQGLRQSVYLGSFYFYLHFSYNGWFFFGILSVMLGFIQPPDNKTKLFAQLFKAIGWLTIPNFLLSILWLNEAGWIHNTALLSSALQLLIYGYLVYYLFNELRELNIRPLTRVLWTLSGISLSIKILFQFLSNFEVFEKIAFSHRAVIIGYLHLVLLGFVTLFLVGMLIEKGHWRISPRYLVAGSAMFTTGILLNEILLMVQGLLSIQMKFIPSTNVYLFAVAGWMVAGIFVLLLGMNRKNDPVNS